MSKCLNPQFALYFLDKSKDKYILKFLPRDSYSFERVFSYYDKSQFLEIPCGKCESCQKNYRFQWSIRCLYESLLYPESYFLTLTYDDDHIKYATDNDLKKFIKALRNNGQKIRYFACKEFGLKTNRIHFHAILFGVKLKDLKYYNNHYESNYLKGFWHHGNIQIMKFDSGCAFYIAGYVKKKEDKTTRLYMSQGLGKDAYQLAHESGKAFYVKGQKLPLHIKALDKLLGYEVAFKSDFNEFSRPRFEKNQLYKKERNGNL